MGRGNEMKSKVVVSILMALGLVAMTAVKSAAHRDPAICSQPGAALVMSTFRADGITTLTGTASECETVVFHVRLSKPADVNSWCAFSGGTLSIITPDGVSHVINANVP